MDDPSWNTIQQYVGDKVALDRPRTAATVVANVPPPNLVAQAMLGRYPKGERDMARTCRPPTHADAPPGALASLLDEARPGAPQDGGARWASPSGLLGSEQRLEWEGQWPERSSDAEIARLLEQAHFRSVEQFSLGLVRCRRTGARVTCALPSGLVALAFEDEGTKIAGRRVERQWRIVPGVLATRPRTFDHPTARGVPFDAGTLAVGLEAIGEGRLRAWLRVSAFPSRFIAPLPALPRPLRWLRLPWAAVGAAYTLYHAQASYGTLRRIARLTANGHG